MDVQPMIQFMNRTICKMAIAGEIKEKKHYFPLILSQHFENVMKEMRLNFLNFYISSKQNALSTSIIIAD